MNDRDDNEIDIVISVSENNNSQHDPALDGTVLLQVKVERGPFRISYNSTGDSHHAQDS